MLLFVLDAMTGTGCAHGIHERLFDDTTLSLKEIAKEEDVVGSYVTRLLRLSFLL